MCMRRGRNRWAASCSSRRPAGLPIVATDVGGTREIFCARPPSALLVPVDAVESLAESVRAAAGQSPRLQRDLGQAARRRAETAFDVHQAARRLASHYFEVAGPEARRRSES